MRDGRFNNVQSFEPYELRHYIFFFLLLMSYYTCSNSTKLLRNVNSGFTEAISIM